jgi:hypothetical protein
LAGAGYLDDTFVALDEFRGVCPFVPSARDVLRTRLKNSSSESIFHLTASNKHPARDLESNTSTPHKPTTLTAE